MCSSFLFYFEKSGGGGDDPFGRRETERRERIDLCEEVERVTKHNEYLDETFDRKELN